MFDVRLSVDSILSVDLVCTVTITITMYFIHPSGKLKLSFDRTTENISQ